MKGDRSDALIFLGEELDRFAFLPLCFSESDDRGNHSKFLRRMKKDEFTMPWSDWETDKQQELIESLMERWPDLYPEGTTALAGEDKPIFHRF